MCMYNTSLLGEAEARYEAGGAACLSDSELVQLTLGLKGKNAGKIIDSVISGMMDGLPDDARKKADLIAEFARRFYGCKGRSITCPGDIYKYIRHYAFRAVQENFVVISLNGAHEIISTFVSTTGLLNRSLVHPREVFARPMQERAAAIMIAHNHPSGRLEPSQDDIDVTKRIVECGTILGLKVLDHLVFSEDNYYSLLEHGLM